MTRLRPLVGAAGGWVFSATVTADRPPANFTARVMPRFDGVAIPLEDARILWQR
jgi:starch phosphorylase